MANLFYAIVANLITLWVIGFLVCLAAKAVSIFKGASRGKYSAEITQP